MVHFATHGVLAGQLTSGAEPGLILTPPDTATEADDGCLSASEIAAIKLDADWVASTSQQHKISKLPAFSGRLAPTVGSASRPRKAALCERLGGGEDLLGVAGDLHLAPAAGDLALGVDQEG